MRPRLWGGEETITGFNKSLAQQKDVPGTASLTLIQFDDQYELHHKAIPLDEVTELTQQDFEPRGMTALLDAIGRTINGTRRRIRRLPAADRPDQVIMAILTDGLENASSRYSLQRVNDLIAAARKAGWTFYFLGANQDAIATGRQLGIDRDHSIRFSVRRDTVDSTWGTLSRAFSSSRSMKDSSGFTEDERRRSSDEGDDGGQ